MKSFKWYDILIPRCLKKSSKGEKKYIMEREKLTFHLEGETEIDVETLMSTLENTVNCLTVIADNVLTKKDFYKFVVKDMRKGSFVLDIEVIKNIVDNIAPLVPMAGTIIPTFVEIVKIKKALKGELPKDIKEVDNNKISITLNDNSSINFNNSAVKIYINNPELDDNLSKLSGDISKDQNRGSIKISDGKEELCIDKKELPIMATPIDVGRINNDDADSYNKVWLTVRRAIFDGNEQWVFKSREFNRSFSAKIMDMDFLGKIKNAEIEFSVNTKINALVRTEGKQDMYGNPVGKQTYTIVKVYEVKKNKPIIDPLL